MASGLGTRFGGNKLMTELGGVPLIQHVLRATDDLFARRVVVTRHPDVARLCDMRRVEAILHDEPLRNDTVRLGMEKMADCDTVTFVQGDQPLVSANSLAALLRGAESHPDCIWRASFRGTPSAPVLFPSWSFDELRSLPPGKGGGVVAKAHKEHVRTIEVSSKWELFDVDTHDDLRILQEHLASEIE
ncbi:nucleotidyltransferase family protein [Ellagibacter isourolithinifaciens]|uniref:nucleotidyltransferase family protein n=1 Tax=Ellagibacter isourolithinifaciens TaxID=2137581 RepID=UPI003AAD7A5D